MRSSPIQRCASFILAEYEEATKLWDPILTPYCPDTGWTEFRRGDNFPFRRTFSDAEFGNWMDHMMGIPLPGVRQSGGECVDWSGIPRDVFHILLHPRAVPLPECAHCNAPSVFLRQCAACREVRYCNSTWSVA